MFVTVANTVAFSRGLFGKPRNDAVVERVLRQLALWDKRDSRCEGFSRGMKQKLALAGALIHEPRLLILDEPLTGLDAAAARSVKDILLEQVAAGGTVILTTHILEVAERIAQRQPGIALAGREAADDHFWHGAAKANDYHADQQWRQAQAFCRSCGAVNEFVGTKNQKQNTNNNGSNRKHSSSKSLKRA